MSSPAGIASFVAVLGAVGLLLPSAALAAMPIEGEAREGETLTTDVSHDRELAGYEWQSCDPATEACADGDPNDPDWVPIRDAAPSSPYTLRARDIGPKVRAAGLNVDGAPTDVSTGVGPVAAAVPVNRTSPSVDGEAREGATLTADPGRWQSSVPTTFAYQWQRYDGGWADMPGATNQTYVPGSDDVGHALRVRVVASNSGGASQPAFSTPTAQTAAHQESQSQDPPPPVPPAKLRETANLQPLEGEVFVREAGSDRFVRLEELSQVRLPAQVDVRAGVVEVITARNRSGKQQSGKFWAGRFRLRQTSRRRAVTELKLTGGPRRGPARRHRSSRRLWGKGKCRCRTRGKRSASTVRGTQWLTIDRARTTVTKVKRGRVAVRDFARRRTVIVRRGERYVARPRR